MTDAIEKTVELPVPVSRVRGAVSDSARSYLDRVSREWDDALSRLKRHLEC